MEGGRRVSGCPCVRKEICAVGVCAVQPRSGVVQLLAHECPPSPFPSEVLVNKYHLLLSSEFVILLSNPNDITLIIEVTEILI